MQVTLWGSDSSNGLDINLNRISHSLENITIDDDGMRCDIKVLDTPLGKVVESLMDAGVGAKNIHQSDRNAQ